ncbi:MAG: response regulator [Pseudomonadota bacterium]|nr:response regulator [Pseudomonadota bacterium]
MSFQPVPLLIVDDLDENLVALEALLRSDSVAILRARSGPEALELLLQHEVALALIDVQMPGMDGFELAELMHGNQRTRGIPIIFLTAGRSDDGRHYKGYEAGAVDFLHKPIDPDILKSKVGVFFELHRRHQEIARQRDEIEAASEELRRYTIALKEADQRKDEFLATLAHELRTPLAPIRNGLEILRRQPSPDLAEKACELMDRQLSHMVQLIDDLLDMSRVSKGKIVLRKETTPLQAVIGPTVDNARHYIDNAGHTLRVEISDTPLWIDADVTRVDQIVSNLLSNAAKYTPAGGTIVLSATEDAGEAVIRVTDNGIGIPANMQTRIFDLFMQVNTSISRSQGGLGIGLALVRNLVNLHGGKITVESAGPDQGSTFTVRLPLVRPPAELPAAQNDDSAACAQGLRILVVDDNTDSAETTGWLLESMGHSDIRLAHDGPQALALAAEFEPDVILLDIGLPGMNGYDVCRELRRDPRFADTLIVAQTGWGQDRDREMAHFAGFSQHLVKPLKPDDLASLFTRVKPRAHTASAAAIVGR